MPKRYHICAEAIQTIEEARKVNQDKKVERRLRAVLLYAEGKSHAEIGEIVGYAWTYITALVRRYRVNGLQALTENKHIGNRRNMTVTEEATLLDEFRKQAEDGKIIEVSDIKKAYQERVGHTIGGSQIYYVLARHEWRKVMPRSKHPNKASDEVIEASKKLTLV